MNTINISKADLKTIQSTTLDSNNNTNGNNKRVTINFTNAQDLLACAPLTRITTASDGSSSSSTVPMITIHIIPEVAQALLGSTTVDKAKLAELLQQASVNNASTTISSDNTTNSTS
jgi:translation elongation factor EF-G